LTWVAVTTSAVVLFGSTALYVAYKYYDGRLGKVDLHKVLPNYKRPPAGPAGSENFLLIGSDTRALPGDAGYQAPVGSADYTSGQRSDTVILVHLPSGSGRPTVVSFPRDSYVAIPEFTDTKTHHVYPAHHDKLNSAFSEGGPALLIQVIEQLSGLKIDHFAEIDFAGFKNMVNALGGVSICVGTTRHDKDSGDFLTAGRHTINGDQALAFVRDRKQFANGDITRIQDQQYFLSVVMHQVESAGTLVNPLKLNAFLDALTKSVTVDNGLTLNGMRKLAGRLHGLSPGSVDFTTVPFATSSGNVPGVGSVVLLDQEKDQILFDSLRGIKPPPIPTVPVAPSTVPVRVFNAAGTSGLAHRAVTDLTADGFTGAYLGGSLGSGATGTVVQYPPGHEDWGKTVQAAIPGSTLEAGQGITVVHLLVGTSWNGAKHVQVAPSATTPASASPQPATQASTPPNQTGAQAAASCAP
jgi:LCP family protein required for cell wall assembly